MSYIEKNLSSKETIIKRAHISKVFVFGRPAIVATVVTPLFLFFTIGAEGSFSMALFFGIIIALPFLISGLILLLTTEIALTNERVIMKWGLIKRNSIEVFTRRVEGMIIDQGIIGRIFDFGSMNVGGTGGSDHPVRGVKSPLAFRQAVNEEISKFSDQQPSPKP